MSLTDIPELGMIFVILAVVALTSITTTMERDRALASNQQLPDKNSSLQYSTVIDQLYDDDTDLSDAIVAIIMGCDTDKLADITVRIIRDGDVMMINKLSKDSVVEMKNQVMEIINNAVSMGLGVDEYFAHLTFNVVYMDIYVS